MHIRQANVFVKPNEQSQFTCTLPWRENEGAANHHWCGHYPWVKFPTLIQEHHNDSLMLLYVNILRAVRNGTSHAIHRYIAAKLQIKNETTKKKGEKLAFCSLAIYLYFQSIFANQRGRGTRHVGSWHKIIMPRQERPTTATSVCHAILRGMNKQQVFGDEEDYASVCPIYHQKLFGT